MDIDDSSSLSSLSDHEEDNAARKQLATPVAAATVPDASTGNGDDNGASRRRSTRIVKKVQVYSEPPSMRKPKRKRTAGEESDEDGNDGEKAAAKNGTTSPSTVRSDDNGETQQEEEDGEDEDEDEESESEDEPEESEGEPDEEELKELRRRGKRAAAAARGAASKRGRGGRQAAGAVRKPVAKRFKASAGERMPVPEPRRRAGAKSKDKGKGKATNGDAVPPMVNGLYEAVFENEESHDDVASEWVAKYQQDPEDGMKEMVNFIIKCCGCDNEVTNYDIVDQDSTSATLLQIQDAFSKQQTADYPLTSKKPVFRKFRAHLSSFIEALVTICVTQNLVVIDPALLENMQTWITAMSSSSLRQFRHTATVFALDMVSHLSAKAAEIRRANGVTNRQLETEQKRVTTNEARIKALSTKLKNDEARREAVEAVIKDMFETVFVHRYRDIDPKIRIDCMHELGNWIHILPDIFFEGTYIRYLGWVLSDTVAATRLEVVKALTRLFKKKGSVSGLRHFTERFRPRLVEMGTRDADTAVRAATIELLDTVREVGYLEPGDIEAVGRLLFDSEQKVRRAVVGFFVENIQDLYQEKLEELGGEEAVQEALGYEEDENNEGPTLSWIKLKCLVEALSSYDRTEADEDSDGQSQNIQNSSIVEEIVSRFSLAGAVLWDALDEVRDWEGLARYLLYDHSASRTEDEEAGNDEDVEKQVKKAVALDSKEDVILLHLLNASVTGSIFKGPDPPNKKKPQVRTVKEIEKHKENVSRSLMTFIPLLLKKFGPVPDAASSVLRLERLMNLDVFQELRQSAAYSSLLDEINRQFLTHADEGVLKEASAALMHAKTFEDLEEVTELKLGQLKDETVSALGNAVRGKDLATAKFSDTNLTELINTVRRLEYLSGITDCVETLESPLAAASAQDKTQPKPLDILLDLLTRGTTADELVEELILRVLKTIGFYFMWKLQGFNNTAEDADDIELDQLLDRRSRAVKRVTTILTQREEVDGVKIAAASTLLDLTTIFISSRVPRLASVVQPLDKSTQAQLMTVFDVIEKTFAKGCGKRLEPDEHAEPEDEEEEGENEADESTQLMLEQRLCEFTGKIILAALAAVLDPKNWRKRLTRNQTGLGSNYKEVVNYLDRASVGKPGIRRGAQKKTAMPPPPLPKQHRSTKVVEEDDEGEEEEHHEEEEEHHNEEEDIPEHEDGEEEHEGFAEGSDPDPEAKLPASVTRDHDEEMLDV